MNDQHDAGETYNYGLSGDIWFTEHQSRDVDFSYKVRVLAEEQSPFQHIVFMDNPSFGRMFSINGFMQVTEADEFVYHDMIVHPALAVNPDIRRVLIIGGGDGGTARETLRYRQLERIDMVEIDEAVVRMSKQYLPVTACAFDDARLNLIIGDGLAHVQNSPDNSYDLILVDSTDPVGPGEGLFTFDFYRHCYRILGERGILINQQESAFYPGDFREMQRAQQKIKATFPIAMLYSFNMPSYGSGSWFFGFASKRLHPLNDHQPERWEQFGLDTRYYNRDIHRAAFALPNYLRRKLEQE
ncbi:MAG: polyamine aminopropyltransferase [Bacillota bacterium]|nr:polyamine aminopropyltransferase [Bacillota bacterium]